MLFGELFRCSGPLAAYLLALSTRVGTGRSFPKIRHQQPDDNDDSTSTVTTTFIRLSLGVLHTSFFFFLLFLLLPSCTMAMTEASRPHAFVLTRLCARTWSQCCTCCGLRERVDVSQVLAVREWKGTETDCFTTIEFSLVKGGKVVVSKYGNVRNGCVTRAQAAPVSLV